MSILAPIGGNGDEDHKMKPQGGLTWFMANRRGLILGGVVGAIVAPCLAVLGLAIAFFEVVRPFLIGPMDLLGSLIPNVQTAPNRYDIPVYKWMLTLGFNGICYALLGGMIQSVLRFWASARDQ